MGFFQVPPPTRYDLNFTLLGFPVRVSPLFWLMAIFFGLGLDNILAIFIWIGVVFVSILIHELGHGLAMRRFGEDAYIVLHLFGGLAVPVSARWGGTPSRSTAEQVIISLAGPLAGFLTAGLVILLAIAAGGSVGVNWLLFIIPVPFAFVPGGLITNTIVTQMLWVNVFWGLINLIPVFPLDGGQVSRSLFTEADPWDGLRKSLWVSVIAGALAAILGLIFLRSLWVAFLFGILALQSYLMIQGRGGMGL